MLVGHFAPALALRPAARSIPLWALLVASQAVDFGFFTLVLAGIESGSMHPGEAPRFVVTNGIWSHSLLMTAIYGVVIAGIGAVLGRRREGLVIAAVVVSHWAGDLIVHDPDLPLAFDQTHAVGLGLWRIPIAAWALECSLLVGGGWLWIRTLSGAARRRATGFVVSLLALQTLADFVSPVPPSDVQLGLAGIPLFVVLAGVAWWVDRPD